jgi:hypothetical protein
MSKFTQLAGKAFDDYHNTPHASEKWSLTDAYGHVVEFLCHDHTVEEMPGLKEAFAAMTPGEWDSLRQRYPEHVRTLIDPLQREVGQGK